jgi:hypothetical protein
MKLKQKFLKKIANRHRKLGGKVTDFLCQYYGEWESGILNYIGRRYIS